MFTSPDNRQPGEPVKSSEVPPMTEERVAELDAKYMVQSSTAQENKEKGWLPYKTPINLDLFNNPVFKNTMLSLPTTREDLPISGQQAYELALPAIQEIVRLQRDGTIPHMEKTNAIAKLQEYLGRLQADPVNTQYVTRARDTVIGKVEKKEETSIEPIV